MEPSEENVQMLINMGFGDLTDIKKALRLAQNDVNEAVAILTQEQPGLSYETVEEETKEAPPPGTLRRTFGPQNRLAPDPPPPSYDEAVEPVEDEDPSSSSVEAREEESVEVSKEFPQGNLYELEGRVFTDQWSIPYKKEESLGKCLVAATRLASEGLLENDENCMRFVNRCMPEAFRKLMTSKAVHRWGAEIHEGIYNMLQLFIELVAVRLKYKPVPIELLEVLGMALNPETEFHYKNRAKKWDHIFWEEKFGVNSTFAVSPPFETYKDPCGWLVNLINAFAYHGGMDQIRDRVLESLDDVDPPTLSTLMQPLGYCGEYLNPLKFAPFMSQVEKQVLKYVQDLKEHELKRKKTGSISELLTTMKCLCLHFWVDDVKKVDDLRLSVALRMLNSPHFNAKMNSLKEITKMIEDTSISSRNRNAIEEEVILDWLVENKVLSVALEGNIDQSQYADKLKGIVEFLGPKLSIEDLTKIWKMQNDQPLTVVDNIHSIMAAAAVKFSGEQLEHLFHLIQKAWQNENERVQEKLLSLIGRIGRDARSPKTTCKVLELLWDLAHLPAIPKNHMEHALEEHLFILSDSLAVGMQIKNKYVAKCVEDIKRCQFVVPALRQIHQIAKGITKQSYSKTDKSLPQELNKTYDIIKLTTQSLMKCHKMAINAAGHDGLSGSTIVDGKYTHCEHVEIHLKFLAFILQEGALYLPWHRAREIWDTLVANPEACEADRETCYEWFRHGLADLETETQMQLFKDKLLRLESTHLSPMGFDCVRAFFESINTNNHSLRKGATGLIVEKLDLFGLDFMWKMVLESTNESIAEMAIRQIMSMSYTNLAQRLKKDVLDLHKHFISECYKRLELAYMAVKGTAMAEAVAMATKTLTAVSVPEAAIVPCPSRAGKLLEIERLLQLAETYVVTVEDQFTSPRTILPHGASFQGHTITMHVTCTDSHRNEFVIVGHSNETLQSVRHKIAQRLKTTLDNVQIMAHDRLMLTTKDQKLLSELEFDEEQDLNIKLHGPVSSSVSSSARIDENMSSFGQQSELERSLPGVVMATGGQVFDMLYQTADIDEPRITERVRKLLMMIPTDPSIPESLDSICRQTSDNVTSLGGETSGSESNKDSSRATLEGLFRANSTHGMSAFRVLYNLEVLSSKLMPSMQEDIGTQTSAQNFRESFLNAGGLSLVINALQKDSIPQDVDDETRRGCYSICLQLARFLLCGQTTTDLKESDLSLNDSSVFDNSGADSSTVFSSSYGSSPRKMSLLERISSVEASGDLANREGTSVAITVIQTMNANDFTSMIACLMRVTWAAAAGQLRLASASQPIKEVAGGGFAMGIGRRSRHSSAGSTNSSSSHDSESQVLHAGICLNTTAVSGKDAAIAREALELLVACLQLRTHNLGALYALPGVNDFIIDILLSSPHPEVRGAALDQFYTLTSTSISNESVRILHPRDFVLQVLLQARVPLWTSSSLVRGANQRILNQSAQYFELRCRLLEGLRVNEQKFLKVNIVSMLGDEIDWLHNFEPGDSEDMNLSSTDNTIVAGHLHLIRTLLTCEGVDKRKIGERLLNSLLNEYLFPASRLVMHQGDNSEKADSRRDYNSKISGKESRVAAFELLVVLCEGCPYNLQRIASQLINMHHQLDPSIAKEWEFLPPVEGRMTKYVGLKNGGATCYMNAVIQQLYMTPGIREGILAGHTPEKEKGEDSIFYQMQNVFGHLLESKLQYYEPERFWQVFKFWGEPVNIREQQDAFDFFTILTDQLDEYLKKSGQKEVMKQKFQGLYLNQMICQDCPHRKEREEEFFALNLTVKSNNLNDSLEQFVRGEMLEGENAYLCEECNEKRNTIKRTCIKTLPPVLVIQLKRFGYDWEAGRALKFDDYFKFPWVLDMEPFTSKGMARREQQQQADDPPSPMNYQRHVSSQSSTDDLYQLVGVVVHSGQANAGHYYSFIKDRGGTSMTNMSKGKWFRFNDTQVEEFIMSDAALEAECFGGSFRSKSNETTGSYTPENRLRTWSGYMLFYEKMEGMRSPDPMARIGRKGYHGDIHGSMDGLSSPELSPTGDRMSELSALVHKGEKRGFFLDKMPAPIQRQIEDENLQFLRNRAVYNQEYITFVRKLASCSLHMTYHPAYSMMAQQSIKLAMHFVLNTLFRTKKKLRYDLEDWRDLIDSIVKDSPEACEWALEILASPQGRDYLKAFLLECPSQEVRMAMANIVKSVMQSFVLRSHDTHQANLDFILEHLLSLLDKEVLEHCRSCVQYFWLLSMYLELGSDTCEHLFRRKAFQRLITFLIGPPSELNDLDIQTRRWTSLQTREFGFLHTMLAAMVLHSDVSPYWSVDLGDKPKRRPILILENLNRLLPVPEDMRHTLFGPPCLKYIKESVLAFREVHSSTTPILDMLLHCSFCNEGFTFNVMMIIHSQVSSAPANELKAIFVLLLELLLLDDPLQLIRLKLAMEGNESNGLFSIIRNCTGNDSRRSYQCIKFLVHLSNKSPAAKEYLTSVSQKWHWAVNWLKKKMTEHYWNPQSSISNESSTSKGFQRTMSAQDTLAEATALLTDLTTQDEDEDDDAITKEEDEGEETTEGTVTPRMEINGSSEGSEVNGNGGGEKSTEKISGIDDVDG